MIIRKKVVDKKIAEFEEQQSIQYQDEVQDTEAVQVPDENIEEYNRDTSDEDYDYPDTPDEDFIYNEELPQNEQEEISSEEEIPFVQEEYAENNLEGENISQEEQLNQNELEMSQNQELQEQNLDANLTPEEYSEPQNFEQASEEIIPPEIPEELPPDEEISQEENSLQEQEVLQEEIPPQEEPVQQTQQAPQPHQRRIKEKEQLRKQPASLADEEINLFDLDNIDFSQRQERRRGDRRRGFRRVDDRNLVSRAREEADAIRQSAMNEGYQYGLEAAQADIEVFKSSVSEFMKAKQEVFEYIAPDILEISVDIAQKIIKKEIEQNPQVLFNTIVDVLKTLSKEETKVTLRVNPLELNTVKEAVPRLITLAGIDTKVVVLSDENVTEGGCLVTTTNGIVDATVESRIRVVMQALREM